MVSILLGFKLVVVLVWRPDTGGKKLFVLPGVVPASASLLQKQGRPSLHVSKNSDVDHSALLHTIQTLQHSLLIQV